MGGVTDAINNAVGQIGQIAGQIPTQPQVQPPRPGFGNYGDDFNQPNNFNPYNRPGQPMPRPMGPTPFNPVIGGQQGGYNPQPMPLYQGPGMNKLGQINPNPVMPQTQPQAPQQGLGGLQLNKWQNRLR